MTGRTEQSTSGARPSHNGVRPWRRAAAAIVVALLASACEISADADRGLLVSEASGPTTVTTSRATTTTRQPTTTTARPATTTTVRPTTTTTVRPTTTTTTRPTTTTTVRPTTTTRPTTTATARPATTATTARPTTTTVRPTTTTTARPTTTTTRPTTTTTTRRPIQTATLEGPGVITIWGPEEKNFGRAGQSVANIVGNVKHSGLDKFTVSVNGARPSSLPIGPSRGRLISSGDFNAEIPYDDLRPGDNTVEFSATYTNEVTYRTTVVIDYEPSFHARFPVEIDWSDGFSPYAQIIDGNWKIDDRDRLYPVDMGYDRLVSIGDLSWTDFEITTSITVTDIKAGALAGLGLRWRGHEQLGTESPAIGYWNIGAYVWHRFGDDARLDVYGDHWSPSRFAPFEMKLNREYLMKARVETVDNGTDYRMKMWPAGEREPDRWQVQIVDEDKGSGSVVLVANQADVRYGAIRVEALD